MNRYLGTAILIGGLGDCGLMAQVELPSVQTQRPGAPEYETFSLILENNIFDPNREAASDEPPPRPQPEVRYDVIQFHGTLRDQDKVLAFFSGAGGVEGGPKAVGDAVGEFVVESIGEKEVSIKLEGETDARTLVLGAALERPEGGEWSESSRRLSDGASRSPFRSSSSAPVTSRAPSSSSTETSGSESAESGAEDPASILEQMRRRRQEDLGQ